TLFDGPQRFAGHAIEHVQKTGLARLRDDIDRLAAVRDGQELRRGRVVVVEDVVVDHLEVPDAPAGPGIQRNQAVAEEIRARSIGAVEVVFRTARRDVDDAAGGVDRELGPGVGAADRLPRVLRPRVVSELAFARDRVERPDEATGTDVVRAHVAGRRVVLLIGRRAENDQVLEHAAGRRRLHGELFRFAPEPFAEVDAAVDA